VKLKQNLKYFSRLAVVKISTRHNFENDKTVTIIPKNFRSAAVVMVYKEGN
jgi:hypothetical protein